MTAKPRAALYLPGRAGLSGWGLWRRKHGGRKDRSTVRQGTGRGDGVPPCWGASSGSWDVPGQLCPWELCAQRRGRQPGTGSAAPSPVLGFLQPTGTRLSAQRCGQPRGLRGFGVRGVSGGHEDAWSNGAHPGTQTLMRERGPAGPRHGRASGGDSGDRAGGRGRGGPCPARAFIHGRRSAAPAPPGAEVLQSN